jgi:hypothetical protein
VKSGCDLNLNLYVCCILFEFICLLYFLTQEIIYRGGQIIKPATVNQHNHGGSQKVPAAVKPRFTVASRPRRTALPAAGNPNRPPPVKFM